MIDPTTVQARIAALQAERTRAQQEAAALDRAYSAAIGELEALLAHAQTPAQSRISAVVRDLVRRWPAVR